LECNVVQKSVIISCNIAFLRSISLLKSKEGGGQHGRVERKRRAKKTKGQATAQPQKKKIRIPDGNPYFFACRTRVSFIVLDVIDESNWILELNLSTGQKIRQGIFEIGIFR
jgi:hypothetical protein